MIKADYLSSPGLAGNHPGEEWLFLYSTHYLPAIPHQGMGSNEISPTYGEVPTGFVIVQFLLRWWYGLYGMGVACLSFVENTAL